MTAAITMENLSVAYRGRMALRNVSLSVAAGECVGVFGHNGAGKSTLLRTLLGLARPVDGRVFVLGVPLERSYLRGLRTRIGYVPQAHAVDPRLPVRVQEAVLSGRCGRLGPLRVPGVEDHDAVRRALARTGLARMANRPFGQLSGGEQQRVLLARALAQDPDLLLLDEPTSSLDRAFRRRLCEILRQTHRECGLTTLVVSHDEETLSLLCDRILLLDGGRVTGEMSAPTFSQWCEREAVAVP